MSVKKQVSFLLVVLAAWATATSASVDPAGTSAVGKSKAFAEWSRVYDQANGDRSVPVFLSSSRRGLSTEEVEAHGFVELDLIAGRALIELKGLAEPVDVWLLDNKPGPGQSILPEPGDVLIHLARVPPGDGGAVVTVEKDFGADFFRGVEVNWILVARAGEPPARSRLLYGTRSYFEILYTRQRLAREGFVESPAPRPSPAAKAAETPAAAASPPVATEPHEVLVKTGLVSQDVFDGADVFFRETFEGNGRSCGSCHPAENNQTIEKAFIATLPDGDPLFIAEQVPPGHPISQLERPPLMREFGLILENVDGLENPNVKFLMRSVPHSLSLATSILAPPGQTTPFEDRTGWSGDGAPPPGRLIEFTLGAIIQHYPKNSLARLFKEDAPPGIPFDFRMPTDDELHDNNEFMLNVGRLNELVLGNVALTNDRADNGRQLFIVNACNGCHDNASANVAGGVNFNFNTSVEEIFNPAQGFMGINFPLDGGFLGQGLALPNRDCDFDGDLDCFGDGTFNTAPLIEAADTGPFFHNNTSATIEAAVDFYNNPPFQVVDFTDDEVNDVAAFLRIVNVSFNLAMAIQRDEAVLVIDPVPATSVIEALAIRGTANKLLLLSNDEIDDALAVLTDGPLGDLDPKATELAKRAFALNRKAFNTQNVDERAELIAKAIGNLREANAHLGTGVGFDLGEGNLLF